MVRRTGRPPGGGNSPITGSNLKERRIAAGLSAQQLANRLDDMGRPTTSSTIYSWEKDRSRPSSDDVKAVARILRCRLADLACRERRAS